MTERRHSVRVGATANEFEREFGAMRRDAVALQAALRAIPNTVTVNARSSGFDKVERDAQRAFRSSSLLVDSVAMLAPTLAPLSAVAVAGLGALSAQAAAALGSVAPLLLATNGLGDALEAINEARLDPSVENLQEMDRLLSALPEETAAFARRLDSLRPLVDRLQATSAAGLFPGVNDGLDALLTRGDEVETILGRLAEAQGELARAAGEDLAGPEWDAFFDMVERDAKPTLLDLGSTIGSLGSSLANVATGLAPLNREIGAGIADWADNLERLSRTADYDAFMEYVRENGPQVLDTLGALGKATLDLAQAAGAIGGPTLQIIESVARALSAIAGSPAGPVLFATAAGLAAVNRALAIRTRLRDQLAADFLFGGRRRGASPAPGSEAASITATTTAMQRGRESVRQFGRDFHNAMVPVAASPKQLAAVRASQERVRASLAATGKTAAGLGAVTAVASGATESIGVTNTVLLGLAGTMAGPWGAAAGATVGAFLDIKAAGSDVAEVFDRIDRSQRGGSIVDMQQNLTDVRDVLKDAKSITGFGDFFGDAADTLGAFFAGDIGITETVADGATRAIKQQQDVLADTRAANAQKAAQDALARGYTLTAEAAERAADGAIGVSDALTDGQRALSRFNAQEAYRSTVAELNKALKENGRTLDANTDKGRANRAQLQRLAADTLNLASTLPDGQAFVALQRGRDEVVEFAKATGMGQRAAERFANSLGLFATAKYTPEVKLKSQSAEQQEASLRRRLEQLGRMVQSPRVKAETADAENRLRQVQAQLRAIQSKSITITTFYKEVGAVRQSGTGSQTRRAFATGGQVFGPGTTTSDDILALLSNREFVHRAKAVEYYGADFMHRLNRMEIPKAALPAYANGGLVGAYAAPAPAAATRVSVSAPNVQLGNTTVLVALDGLDTYVEGRIIDVQQQQVQHAAGARIGR